MKGNVLLVAFLLIAGTATTQNPLGVGQTQLNAGVGLSSWGIPLYVGLDFGVHRDISVGFEVSLRAYNEYWKKAYYYRHFVAGISGNGNYHFNRILDIPPQWDLYLGLNLGFFLYRSPDDYPGDRATGLGLGAQLGGRYYFTDKVGINLEFGGGNAFSGGKFGVSVKL